MVTAADGPSNYYTLKNNKAHSEALQEALVQNDDIYCLIYSYYFLGYFYTNWVSSPWL
jgi:hypothetical protein